MIFSPLIVKGGACHEKFGNCCSDLSSLVFSCAFSFLCLVLSSLFSSPLPSSPHLSVLPSHLSCLISSPLLSSPVTFWRNFRSSSIFNEKGFSENIATSYNVTATLCKRMSQSKECCYLCFAHAVCIRSDLYIYGSKSQWAILGAYESCSITIRPASSRLLLPDMVCFRICSCCVQLLDT